ncbi:MAG: DDE-type integrase/transposase/recombinase [Pseudobdellovibrionaceae bacterium]
MNTTLNYRTYPETVKDEVARTGNIYLFPDLNIPRTTAQYWVKKQKYSRQNNLIEIESVYKRKSAYLQKELEKEKALRRLLEVVRRVFPYDFRTKNLKDKMTRRQIVDTVRECIKLHKLSHCLVAIGLSKSAYQRWASEISFCKTTKRLCERRKASQLTSEEVAVMKNFVTSKKFAHISISSLHLLAQRTGELFCSIDTWYKYVRCFEWKRPWKQEKKKIQKTGIRASKANEIWHLDVTVVNIRPGYKLYIQAIIDNFSRFVLAWRVTEEVNARNTVETLALAKIRATELLESEESTNVMMDPGTENNNKNVLQFTTSRNLVRTLARVDIHYSNSMVESLFRMLKNNYLYHQGINNIGDLIRKADFYFRQHNNVIPLAVHRGGTPAEVFLSSWGEAERGSLQVNKLEALTARKKKNLQPSCGICPA